MAVNKCCNRTLKLFLVFLLFASLCLIIIAIATNHWVHYEETTLQNVKMAYEAGLFRVCVSVNGNSDNCGDADDSIRILSGLGDADLKICFFLSAAFLLIAILVAFGIIIHRSKSFCAAAFLCALITAAIVSNLAGIIIFVVRTDDNNIDGCWAWSFILCCISAGILLLVLFVPFCIDFRRSKPVVNKKKFSVQQQSIKNYDSVMIQESYVIKNNSNTKENEQKKEQEPQVSPLRSFNSVHGDVKKENSSVIIQESYVIKNNSISQENEQKKEQEPQVAPLTTVNSEAEVTLQPIKKDRGTLVIRGIVTEEKNENYIETTNQEITYYYVDSEGNPLTQEALKEQYGVKIHKNGDARNSRDSREFVISNDTKDESLGSVLLPMFKAESKNQEEDENNQN